jgi:CheY-like chemotaxis protein
MKTITMEKLHNIMIVDDDEIYHLLFSEIIVLADVANKISPFLTVEESLNYLNTTDDLPELIFLDINMPGLDGWDFLKEFDKLNENIKNKVRIVMLSSSIFEEDRIKALQNKYVTEFVVKPINVEKVKSLVKELPNQRAVA